MKKTILFGAALAALATFTSCSNDEDLVLQEPVAPVTTDTGVPFGVSVSTDGDATRGVDLTASAFEDFYLYGVKTDDGSKWFDGVHFAKTSELWSGSETAYRWSDGATTTWHDGTYNFYAVTSTTGVTSPTFTTTDSKFDYTVNPDNVATQEDLMVAKNLNQSSTTNGGKLGLDFYHALASIKVSVRFVKDHFDYEESDGNEGLYFCKIKSITFHNIKSQGTFDFSSGDYGAWINQDEYADYTLTVDEDSWGSNGIDANGYISYTEDDAYVPLTFNEGPLFVIPQTITPWATANTPQGDVPLSTAETNNNSYISIECQIYNLTVDETNADPLFAYYWVSAGGTHDRPGDRDDAGYGTLYFPLKITNGLQFNKTHHLKITLEGGFGEDGKVVNDEAYFSI